MSYEMDEITLEVNTTTLAQRQSYGSSTYSLYPAFLSDIPKTPQQELHLSYEDSIAVLLQPGVYQLKAPCTMRASFVEPRFFPLGRLAVRRMTTDAKRSIQGYE